MIHLERGNLLAANTEALVNTVNTVGVMGKGIALQFKQAFPENFKAYKRASEAGQIRLGHMLVFDAGRLTKPYYIINFPTKKHWRSRSRLKDIESGLDDLVRVIKKLDIRSIAVPPLGCGNGGLDWSDVRPRIEAALGELHGVDVALFEPAGAPDERQMPVGTDRPRMTPGRAALLGLMHAYREQQEDGSGVSQIELQKLMYFLQVGGENLRLRFQRGTYGPYADNLNHVLIKLEGHYMTGFGDRSRAVDQMASLDLLPSASSEALDFLRDHSATRERFLAVLDLVEGFESPYGLELLSTVHWVATDSQDLANVEETKRKVRAWSKRKARLFTDHHIAVAYDRLRDSGDWLKRRSIPA